MKLFSLSDIQAFINKALALGGELYEVEPGGVGLGTIVISGAPGYKSAVIREVYLNEWSSGHTLRQYNHLPKKYLDMIDN